MPSAPLTTSPPRSSTTASTTRTRSASIRSRSSGHGWWTSATGPCGGRSSASGKENGVPRETEWIITVGSEVMAVLALATDLHDLRSRLGRIVLAQTNDGTPVTAEDLGVAGSMTVL